MHTHPLIPAVVAVAVLVYAAGAAGQPHPMPVRQLDEALTSVYFWAENDDDAWLEPSLRPLSLDAAAVRLANSRIPRAEARRRAAVAALYVAPANPARERALGRLGFPRASLDAGFADWTTAGFQPSAFEVERRLAASAPPAVPGCEIEPEAPVVVFDHTTLINEATYRVSVNRSVADLGPVLDPQSWDVCTPQMWKNTHVAKPAANGTYQPNASHDVAADPSPPTMGSAWSGVLFEHLEAPFVVFKVLLNVKNVHLCAGGHHCTEADTPADRTTHEVHYDLRSSLYSRLAAATRDGGITVDDGVITASALGPGKSQLHATKRLRLEFYGGGIGDEHINYLMSLALRGLAQGVNEGVCCRP